MIKWLSEGGIVDVALAAIVIEAIVLFAVRGRWAPFAGVRSVAANLAAGAFLMLAVRIAIADGHWTGIAACLACALVAHVADFAWRVMEGSPENSV